MDTGGGSSKTASSKTLPSKSGPSSASTLVKGSITGGPGTCPSSASSATTAIPVAGSSYASSVAGCSGLSNGKTSTPVVNETRRSSRVKASNQKPIYTTPINKSKTPKLFDDQGRKIATGTDYCDCGDTKCPGCFFPCPNLKCLSYKCGAECRKNRKWDYDHSRAIKESLPWEKQPIPKKADLNK